MSANRNNRISMPESSQRDANEIENRNIRIPNPTITEYFNHNIYEIKNKGYIDEVKVQDNMRILSMNMHGCRPENYERLKEIKEALKKNQVDIALFNEANTKWNSYNISRIERVMRSMDKGVKIQVADSKQWKMTRRSYLPGGLVNIIGSKYTPVMDEKMVTVGRLGNWIAFGMNHNSKRLEIINLYRIPMANGNASGICSSLTQYHLIDGNVKSPNEYRKEIFTEIKNHIRQNKNINDIIIAGDYNQDISSKEITKFHEEIGVRDVHKTINMIGETSDSTYKHGSKQIDSIAASNGIMNYIEGSRLMNYNEIIQSDHRAYMIDIDIREYFKDEFEGWDNVNRVMLNPARKSHREKFKEVIEEQLEIYNLEDELTKMERSASYHQMEKVDQKITQIINEAIKKIEGMKRNIPYSSKKKIGWARIVYYKMKLRQSKGVKIDTVLLNKKREEAEVEELGEMTIMQVMTELQKARTEWEKIKEEGKELREQELLDYVPNQVICDDERHPKKKEKILSGIKNEMKRNHTFQYLTRHVGKGQRDGIRRLHKVDENNVIVETYIERTKIENKLLEYNTHHFTKAHNSIAYKDKIYKALRNDSVRDRILNGELCREDCDFESVYEFLKLLKQPEMMKQNRRCEEITAEQWRRIVVRSKRRSASSIFSRRNYAAYKCALSSDRMTNVLVTYYNIILKNRFYPSRWEKILDVMLSKGKGMVIGKLRTITLIEADIQYIMRILLNDGEKERIEEDERFSKSNYGSRKNYAIESALLEKRIIFDHSLLGCKQNIYHLTDLQSCYDRQLVNIGSIIEESIGVNRNGMQLFSKIIPRWKHYIYTSFGISNMYYGGDDREMAGTGQGNKLSGDICRDTSCLIIKQLEKRNLGVEMTSKVTNHNELISAIAFVDDTDLVVEGENVEEKMNMMLNIYNKLYAATGGFIEVNKCNYFAWQWKWSQGQKKIVNRNATIELEKHKINEVECTKSIKTLGIYMTPAMTWSKQFSQMVEKMRDAINKLANTELLPSIAHLYYNAYLIKKVYFGCGVMTLDKNQEVILQKIYEPVILRKLKLSEKFPRKVLYMRNSALGIGLLKPRTIVDLLSLKLYLGHHRAKTKESKMMQINEDNARWTYGYSKSVMQIDRQWKPKHIIWSDEIQMKLKCRQLEIVNRINEPRWVTANQTIMDFVREYVTQLKLNESIIAPINQVRIFKRMYLPCELIGLNGNRLTKEARDEDAKSVIEWKIKFDDVPRPSKKSFHHWKSFVEWISKMEIITIVDFEPMIKTKYEISTNRQYFREHRNENIIYYEKDVVRYNQQVYREIDNTIETEWNKVIAEMKPNRAVELYGIFYVNIEERDVEYYPFNEDITQSIISDKAVAATDASVKGDAMSGVWIMSDIERSFEIKNEIYHKRWRENTSGSAEVLVMLELMTVLERRGRHINHGSITIGFDNKKHHRHLVQEIYKSNIYAMEAGGEIAAIKDKMNRIKFQVKIVWNKGHEKNIGAYGQHPTKHLLRECDKIARGVRENLNQKEGITNIKFYGNYALKQDDQIHLRSINEIIRRIDAKEDEYDYAKTKLGYRYDMVDIEARNAFKVGRVTTAMLKCVYGYNHYGQRDAIINENMVEEICPRCEMRETWEHVIQCSENKKGRPMFVKDLIETLMKSKPKEVAEDDIISFVEDIMKYVRNDDECDYQTNQQYVGMKELFRGFVVKVWFGVQLNDPKYHHLNKIIVKKCVNYYLQCWKDRNEDHMNEEKQRTRVLRWYHKLLKKVEESTDMQVKKYVMKHQIDVEHSRTDSIRTWINNVKNFQRKMEEIPKDDIRRYFVKK